MGDVKGAGGLGGEGKGDGFDQNTLYVCMKF